MPVEGPFFFAWVTAADTTFNDSFLRMDEYIFSAKRILAEGQKPLLELEMKNPRTPLLEGNDNWAWFAYDDGDEMRPLFFGRLVGVPVGMFQEVITIQLIADPANYKQKVQNVVEPLKVLPWYDQVWIEVGKRDSAEKILETRAAFLDVDPVTHAITVVPFIEGPDGNIEVENHIYDTLNLTVNSIPATSIMMDATVGWTQTHSGWVEIGYHSILTTKADAIIGDWPKPNQSLGGGWFVYDSYVYDALNADKAFTVSVSSSWQNPQKEHNNGDAMSLSVSQTSLAPGFMVAGVKNWEYSAQSGVVDPFGVDSEGDPAPLNIPMTLNTSETLIIGSQVETYLSLNYIAERQRTERVKFLIRADTQPVLADAELEQESEVITVSGADVGVPIVNLLKWSTIAGETVASGQVIFPDDSSVPGAVTAQIAVIGGVAGTVQPNFSDIAGNSTLDGTVLWVSLGQVAPPDNARDWIGDTHYVSGQIILPVPGPFFASYEQLARSAKTASQPSVSVSAGTRVLASNGAYQVCTISGSGLIPEPAFSTVRGTAILSGTAEWTSLGSTRPSGAAYYLCTTGGLSSPKDIVPAFAGVMGETVTDNDVTWKCIAIGDIPAGGSVGSVTAASYFATDRGNKSMEYLGLLVRSRLLYRARCADVTFDLPYKEGIAFTTRKTVTISDPRIPNGIAFGKIKNVEMLVSDGTAFTSITIGCLLGNANAIEEVVGDPEYVDDGYVDDPYQTRNGVIRLLPTSSDLGYTPPRYVSTDDGLTFPLTKDQVVLVDTVHAGIQNPTDWSEYKIIHIPASGGPFPSLFENPNLENQTTPTENPQWVEYQFKPVNSGPFSQLYNVKFSNLTMAKGIDLE